LKLTGVPIVAPSEGILHRLLRVAASVEDGVLALLLTAMIVLAGVQIFLRNLLETGLEWGDPLLRVTVLWLGLLGAMAATRDDNHITIDILSRILPPRAKAASRLVTDLFTAIVCGLLAYHGARLVMFDMEAGTRAFAFVPTWVCELIIPFGFGIIALRFCISFVLRLRRLAGATS
jgi:TRAP-type C4-dicarboxylate transport system permease small subunit